MKEYLLFENSEESIKVIPKGEKRLVKAGGKSICVVRLSSGLVAFQNECPHLGDALHRGHLNSQNEIICPWHAYRFNLSTGSESESRCSDLLFVNLKEKGNKIYLEF